MYIINCGRCGGIMVSPVEACLRPWVLRRNRDLSIDALMRYREVISAMLGISLSQDPEKSWRTYVENMRSVMRRIIVRRHRLGDGVVVLYSYNFVAPRDYIRTPLLSAVRGLVIKWYDNGESRLLAFPFAKFFNYGEMEGAKDLPLGDYVVTEKKDGTLIIAWRDDDGTLHFNTRKMLEWYTVVKGITGCYVDHSNDIVNPCVLAFVRAVKRMGAWEELEGLVGDGKTVMFELVGSVPGSFAGNVDVVRVDDVWVPYALSVRDNITFDLNYIENTEFPVPERYYGKIDDMKEIVRGWRDKEGVVVYYPGRYYRDGDVFRWWNYLVKLKSPLYLLRAEGMRGGKPWWYAILKLVVLDQYDDLRVAFEDEPGVLEFADAVWGRWVRLRDLWFYFTMVVRHGDDDFMRRLKEENYEWLLRYGVGVCGLKKLVLESVPRSASKERVLRFLDRLVSRLSVVLGWDGVRELVARIEKAMGD